jgi:hypothetical protein
MWSRFKETFMKRSLVLSACAALALAVLPGLAQGQLGFVLGAGATFPVGDYGEYAKTGWMVNGGVWAPIGEARSAGVLGEIFYGSNSHDDEGDKTNLYGGFGGATYRLGDPSRPGVFVIGKVGAMAHSYKSDEFPDLEETDWKFAYGLGAGFAIPRGTWVPWITVQYVSTAGGDYTTAFVPVSVGFTYVPGGR